MPMVIVTVVIGLVVCIFSILSMSFYDVFVQQYDVLSEGLAANAKVFS